MKFETVHVQVIDVAGNNITVDGISSQFSDCVAGVCSFDPISNNTQLVVNYGQYVIAN
jgi:hypothetical protein